MKPVTAEKNAIYIRLTTRDRLNLFKARFAVEVGAALTQDDALAILMNAWETQHVDAEAVRYLPVEQAA